MRRLIYNLEDFYDAKKATGITMISKQKIVKVLIRLFGCTVWSAPLMFAFLLCGLYKNDTFLTRQNSVKEIVCVVLTKTLIELHSNTVRQKPYFWPYMENTRWVSFGIKFTRQGFEKACWIAKIIIFQSLNEMAPVLLRFGENEL